MVVYWIELIVLFLLRQLFMQWFSIFMTPRDIVILGVTGSIGTQALDVIRAFPEAFR